MQRGVLLHVRSLTYAYGRKVRPGKIVLMRNDGLDRMSGLVVPSFDKSVIASFFFFLCNSIASGNHKRDPQK